MTSADFTIQDVLVWARTKPADERYDYSDGSSCALCQFFRHADIEFQGVGGTRWWDSLGVGRRLPQGLADALVDGCAWTFGELCQRLEVLLPAEPLSDTWTKADAYLTDIEDVARERVMA